MCHLNLQELLQLVAFMCTKPILQTRDAAQQQEEKKRADSIWTKLRLQELTQWFASSTKTDFMSLKNESTLSVFSVEIFMESIYWS